MYRQLRRVNSPGPRECTRGNAPPTLAPSSQGRVQVHSGHVPCYRFRAVLSTDHDCQLVTTITVSLSTRFVQPEPPSIPPSAPSASGPHFSSHFSVIFSQPFSRLLSRPFPDCTFSAKLRPRTTSAAEINHQQTARDDLAYTTPTQPPPKPPNQLHLFRTTPFLASQGERHLVCRAPPRQSSPVDDTGARGG